MGKFMYIIIIITFLITALTKRGRPDVSLFIFGDSLLDPGNNNYINTTTAFQANFEPYGQTFFNFPTGRFCDGRLVSDFIAEHAKLPLIPAYLEPGNHQYYYGVNFASGGAGALAETHQGLVIDLKTQLGYFKKVEAWLKKELGNAEAKRTLSSAVYMFSIGGNDYIEPLLNNSTIIISPTTFSEYVGMVMGNLTTVIHEIYKRGGRKFGFVKMVPLGCLPALRILNPNKQSDSGCFEVASLLANLHNKEVSKLLLDIQGLFEGFKYSLFDTYTNLRQRIDYPSKYGFKEGKTACCGSGRYRAKYSCGGKREEEGKEFELCPNPNEYVFWDSYHPTESVYKQLADEMWSGSNSGPYNLKQLFHSS